MCILTQDNAITVNSSVIVLNNKIDDFFLQINRYPIIFGNQGQTSYNTLIGTGLS